MDPATIGLIASIAGPYLMNMFSGDDEMPQGDEMNRLLGIQRTRMAQAQPLQDSILRLAMGLMPSYTQSPLGNAQTSQSINGGTPPRAVPRPSAVMRPQGY